MARNNATPWQFAGSIVPTPSSNAQQRPTTGIPLTAPNPFFQIYGGQPMSASTAQNATQFTGFRPYPAGLQPPSGNQPQVRCGVYLQEMSGNVPVHATLLREHGNFMAAWADAEASATAKKVELEEQAKRAGNPFPNLDVHSDELRRNFTVQVDYVFRWRYQVEYITKVATNFQGYAQPYQQQAATGAPSRGQVMPSEQKRTENLMNVKQELAASPYARTNSYLTPTPEEDQLRSIAMAATAEQPSTGTFRVPIESHDNSFGSLDQGGDTIAESDSLISGDDSLLFGDNFERNEIAGSRADVSDEHSTPPQAFTEARRQIDIAGTSDSDIVDSGATKEQAIPKGNRPEASPTPSEKADVDAPTISTPQIDHAPRRFGLYITLSHPPTPAVTYRIQINSSLGQAESDMKVIVGNELTKAKAQGTENDLGLEMGENTIKIVNKNGSQLSYTVIEGVLINEKFESTMETSGSVIDGMSYTRKMFEEATRVKENRDDEREELLLPTSEDAHKDLVEATSEAPKLSNTLPLAKRTMSPDLDISMADAPQDDESEDDVPIMAPSKKHTVKTTQPDMNKTVDMIGNKEQGNKLASPFKSKKRSRENEDGATNLEADISIASPSKRLRKTSDSDAEGEADSDIIQNTTQEPTADSDGLFCRCKQPDDGSHMIACDGEACPNNGWVHLDCVPEVKAPPADDGGASKWYCPDCDPQAFQNPEEDGGGRKKGKRKGRGRKSGGAANRKKLVR